MRLFVSILLPEVIKKEIIHIQREVHARNFFSGTYVPPENFHITILFFGNVEDNLLALIGAQLATVTAPACAVRLKGLEVNSLSHPHVLWVSVDAPGLQELSERIQEAFPAYKEERIFSAHITIARMKKVDKAALKKALTQITVQPMSWQVKEYALQVSSTLPEGPLYTSLGIFKLEERE